MTQPKVGDTGEPASGGTNVTPGLVVTGDSITGDNTLGDGAWNA